jgi:hypothetical protein
MGIFVSSLASNKIENQGLLKLIGGPWKHLFLLDLTRNGITSVRCVLDSQWQSLRHLKIKENPI